MLLDDYSASNAGNGDVSVNPLSIGQSYNSAQPSQQSMESLSTAEIYRELELACLMREKSLLRLKEIAEFSTSASDSKIAIKPKYIAAAVRELVNLEKEMRDLSLRCVNKIAKWTLSIPGACDMKVSVCVLLMGVYLYVCVL